MAFLIPLGAAGAAAAGSASAAAAGGTALAAGATAASAAAAGAVTAGVTAGAAATTAAAAAGVTAGTALKLGLSLASVALTAAGTISAAKASQQAALQQSNNANFEADQLEVLANEERAISTVRAAEAKRQRVIALSRAQAVGAASGGGRAFDLEGDLEAEGVYQGLTELYDGTVAARNYRTQAAVRRVDGRSALQTGNATLRSGFITAGSTIGSGVPSMLYKYG